MQTARTSFALAFVAASVPGSALSAGPPVTEDGKITVDHLVVKLSPTQLRDVETKRLVTLTTEQRRSLGLDKSEMSSTLVILTPFHNDCTCELGLYGIWNTPGSLAFPKRNLDSVDALTKDTWWKAHHAEIVEDWGLRKIVFDSKGVPHHEGKPLASKELDSLLVGWSKRLEDGPPDGTPWMLISLPPRISAEIDQKIRQHSKAVAEQAQGMGIYVMFAG